MRWLFLMIIAVEATITHSGNAKEDFLELFQQKGKLSINSEATKDIIILYSCFIKAVSQYRNVKNTINNLLPRNLYGYYFLEAVGEDLYQFYVNHS